MSKKILVVDDDPNVVKLVKSRLEANNYEVATASNGEEALVRVKEKAPDLIILDIVMPKMDGYTFLKELKAVELTTSEPKKKISVIVLTAKEKMEELFAIEGIAEYLVKPFKSDDLLEKIKKHVG